MDADSRASFPRLFKTVTPNAVLYSDGGGKATAALNPISGADRIVRFFAGLAKKGVPAKLRAEFVTVNGQPGALLFAGDHLESVVSLALDESNKVAGIFLVANPDKLPNKFTELAARN